MFAASKMRCECGQVTNVVSSGKASQLSIRPREARGANFALFDTSH